RRLAELEYHMGLQYAREEGKAEGEARGKAEGEILSILTVLKARFGQLPQRVIKNVYKISCHNRLTELTVAAATCQSLKEFEDAIR
ncbi:MAG: hypothetical protein ACRCUY_10355, partial [Thermoguttaceae bacterium]